MLYVLLCFAFAAVFADPDPKCLQNSQPFPCFRAETRYRFQNEECVSFSGCPGTGNNFASLSECKKSCEAQPCRIPQDSTFNCFRAETIFKYNEKSNVCEQDLGCPEPGTFRTQKTCEETCVKERQRQDMCSAFCASATCAYGTRCGEKDGMCGCIPAGGEQFNCQNLCSGIVCGSGEVCGFANGRCGCHSQSTNNNKQEIDCTQFCSAVRCFNGYTCRGKDGICGCQPISSTGPSNNFDQCASYCSRVRCRAGSTCKVQNGVCGCVADSNPIQNNAQCASFCASARCQSGTSCRFKDGVCGCIPHDGPSQFDCTDFCNNILCGDDVCGLRNGKCGCHPRGTLQGNSNIDTTGCRDYCARTTCYGNSVCGGRDGICGCLPAQRG